MHRAAPWQYRLAWGLGVHLPPPLFQGFAGLFAFNALVSVLFFAAVVVVGWFIGAPLRLILLVGAVAVLLGAVMFAFFCRVQARRLGLPRWVDYNPYGEDDPADADW